MGRHGREVVAACAMLCVGYILLYVLSVGIEGTVAVLAPYTAMLNIGVTMNRWMEVCSVLLNMIMTQTFDLVYAGFLAVQSAGRDDLLDPLCAVDGMDLRDPSAAVK